MRGFCYPHYGRWYRHGDPLAGGPMRRARGQNRCEVEGCEREYLAAGLCSMHYMRKRDTGEVGDAEPKKRAKGEGSLTQQGYVKLKVDGEGIFQHRKVMQDHLGRELLPEETVHHINGVRDDNRLENLELWSRSQPAGQRVSDKVAWAKELLRLYEPEALA